MEQTGEARVLDHQEIKALQHPSWSSNSTIYEVNIRQHTPEGTFAAFERDLPRLKSMGIDILWLMPVHPIGVANRKGGLGSHYSVQDYKAVNPAYGSLDDFKRLVKSAHAQGMKVIIDWVANHSAFDNVWTTEHKDYYLLDGNGNLQPPLGTDWWDVAQLDYNNRNLWTAMIDAMAFWVRDCDIDGFRCDVAEKVPTEFWNESRAQLDAIKPVFMLAEAERVEHHAKAFDMSYAWEFMHICNGIAKGEKHLSDLDTYFEKQRNDFPQNAYRMYFTTNHDENSWNGTAKERLGEMRALFDVLSFTVAGMPLVYTSQEGGESYPNGAPHRLRFFEKDTANWNNYVNQDFYARLLKAHHEIPALWNGEHGATAKRIKTSSDELLYCFKRQKGNGGAVVLLNFSSQPQNVDFLEDFDDADYLSIFDNASLTLFTKGAKSLPGYGYQVFVKK